MVQPPHFAPQSFGASRCLQRRRRRLIDVGVGFAAGQNAEEEEALALLELPIAAGSHLCGLKKQNVRLTIE